jgi:uncharacterized protein (DUF58 family)
MDTSLKKPIVRTIILLVVLVIILVVSNSNTTLNIFSIVIFFALIALVWFKYLQLKNSSSSEKEPSIPIIESVPDPIPVTPTALKQEEKKVTVDEDDEIRTRTGAACEKSGRYVCKDHPKRTVKMQEGNRFPPCRGDKKGHSTVWILRD